MKRLLALPLLDIGLGLAVAIFGLVRTTAVLYNDATVPVLIAIGLGVAAGLYRRAPAAALAIVWVTCIMQVFRGLDIALVQLAVVFVAYGTSRYGRTATVVASAISIPLGGIAAIIYGWFFGTQIVQESGLWQLISLATSATDLGISDTATGLALGFVLVTALLAGPWALGLVVRLREQGRRAALDRERAEQDAARAEQLAGLRAEQARLARDVHDVVGHSLAVIVAQADSTQALPDGEIDRIRAAMANIAASARRSLGDVRAVLSDDPSAHASRENDLESLVDGVRASGNEVAFEVEGTPRPLPPELDAIAYRTLQELLTNALKHGAGAIDVTLSWTPDELGIAVANSAADEPGPGGGTGLAGMRERLEVAGGSLSAGLAGDRWVADARMPVRREGMAE